MNILKALSLLFSCFLASAVQANQPVCPEDTLYIDLQNQTNNELVKDIYFIAKGLQVKDGVSQGKHCYVAFDKISRVGECVESTNRSDPLDYSYKVSDFPQGICMPLLESGRVYFSINYPLERVQVIENEAKNPTIIDPDPFNPKDQDYYKLWDKIEFTYLKINGKNIIWTNPTAVDFFSLPLRLELDKDKYPENYSGFSLSKSDIFEAVHQSFDQYKHMKSGKAWNALFLYAPGKKDDAHLLRLIAPGKAMIKHVQTPEHTFDPVYLSNDSYGFNYLDKLWEYYQTHQIAVDVSELFPPYIQGTHILSGSVKNGLFSFSCIKGCTEKELQTPIRFTKPVVLKTGQGEGVDIPLDPANYEAGSRPFFAGAGLRDNNASLKDFDSRPNEKMAGPIIQRAITSAFDAGMLPAPSILAVSIPDNASDTLQRHMEAYKKIWTPADERQYGVLINKDYFEASRHQAPSLYYQNVELQNTWPEQAQQGPWFDLYSKALHGVGTKYHQNEPIYTFAYDDALGQDGTLSVVSPEKLTIKIGDISGSIIPELKQNEGDHAYTLNMAPINGKFPGVEYCEDSVPHHDRCGKWKNIPLLEDGRAQFTAKSPLLFKIEGAMLRISPVLKNVRAVTRENLTKLPGSIVIQDCLEKKRCVILAFPAFVRDTDLE